LANSPQNAASCAGEVIVSCDTMGAGELRVRPVVTIAQLRMG
jgi:hypothetical protein